MRKDSNYSLVEAITLSAVSACPGGGRKALCDGRWLQFSLMPEKPSPVWPVEVQYPIPVAAEISRRLEKAPERRLRTVSAGHSLGQSGKPAASPNLDWRWRDVFPRVRFQ